jgi:hypothetical protein
MGLWTHLPGESQEAHYYRLPGSHLQSATPRLAATALILPALLPLTRDVIPGIGEVPCVTSRTDEFLQFNCRVHPSF